MGTPREYKGHASDFSFGFDKARVKIGMASKLGDKVNDRVPRQEDTVDADVGIEDFKKLPHKERIASIMEAFAILEGEIEEKVFKNKPTLGGSVACVTFSWLEEIPDSANKKLVTYTANVGDCSTYLVRVKKAGEKVTEVKRLNAHLDHYEEDPDPTSGKTKWKHCYEDGKMRIDGSLAMSRTFGDTTLDASGIRHDPHVEYHEFIISPEEVPYLIDACDGVTEIIEQFSSPAYRKYLESLGDTPFVIAYGDRQLEIHDPINLNDTRLIHLLMQECLQSTAEQKGQDIRLGAIAELITHWAYQGSLDNISDVVVIPGEVPSYMSVYDGHGIDDTTGKAVAEFCRDHFPRILRERCAKKLVEEEEFNQQSHAIYSLFNPSVPEPEKKGPPSSSASPKLTGRRGED